VQGEVLFAPVTIHLMTHSFKHFRIARHRTDSEELQPFLPLTYVDCPTDKRVVRVHILKRTKSNGELLFKKGTTQFCEDRLSHVD